MSESTDGRRAGRNSLAEFVMKPRPPRRRKPRDILPQDVPEVATAAPPANDDKSDPIPEHIRRMLEAAYT
jgi:hypothetical protein